MDSPPIPINHRPFVKFLCGYPVLSCFDRKKLVLSMSESLLNNLLNNLVLLSIKYADLIICKVLFTVQLWKQCIIWSKTFSVCVHNVSTQNWNEHERQVGKNSIFFFSIHLFDEYFNELWHEISLESCLQNAYLNFIFPLCLTDITPFFLEPSLLKKCRGPIFANITVQTFHFWCQNVRKNIIFLGPLKYMR